MGDSVYIDNSSNCNLFHFLPYWKNFYVKIPRKQDQLITSLRAKTNIRYNADTIDDIYQGWDDSLIYEWRIL